MADNVNWDAIKAEYIAGGISQRALAKKHGVTAQMIAGRSAREGWTDERERCKRKTIAKTIDRVSTQKARSLANIMLAADKMADRLAANIDILDNARDTSDIAKALKYTIDTIHQVYGIQTPAQLHRQKMDEEKLKLERERLEMDRKRQDTESHAEPVRIMIVQPGEEAGDA